MTASGALTAPSTSSASASTAATATPAASATATLGALRKSIGDLSLIIEFNCHELPALLAKLIELVCGEVMKHAVLPASHSDLPIFGSGVGAYTENGSQEGLLKSGRP